MFDRISADEKLLEREELGQLDAIIERGQQTFVEVGQALAAIRDRRGYRHFGFTTFERYLQQRWGWSRQRGYQLMRAAEVVTDLAGADEMSTRVDIPTEGRARALATLPQSARRTVVEQLGDLGQYSTGELHQAVRTVRAAIGVRPVARQNEPESAQTRTTVYDDDRIERAWPKTCREPTEKSIWLSQG